MVRRLILDQEHIQRPPFPAMTYAIVGLSGISTPFEMLSQSLRQIIYALLTRAPLNERASSFTPFDLHVLGTPPAFVLSQDQTLHLLYCLPYRALLPQRGFHSLALAPHCFALHPLKEQIPHRPTTAARRTSQRIPASAGSVLRQAFFLSSLFYRILFFF